ncbi:hypothetical protein PIB30_110108, partial [Stylosanthes scabra]|nr:hypothetical protein [Stylosanthes scabra]
QPEGLSLMSKRVNSPLECMMRKWLSIVFEAMQHPEDQEAEECMRSDIIDMIVKEIQEEDMLKKSNAYYEETFATFDDTNFEFFVQGNKEEELQKIEKKD